MWPARAPESDCGLLLPVSNIGCPLTSMAGLPWPTIRKKSPTQPNLHSLVQVHLLWKGGSAENILDFYKQILESNKVYHTIQSQLTRTAVFALEIMFNHLLSLAYIYIWGGYTKTISWSYCTRTFRHFFKASSNYFGAYEISWNILHKTPLSWNIIHQKSMQTYS